MTEYNNTLWELWCENKDKGIPVHCVNENDNEMKMVDCVEVGFSIGRDQRNKCVSRQSDIRYWKLALKKPKRLVPAIIKVLEFYEIRWFESKKQAERNFSFIRLATPDDFQNGILKDWDDERKT